MDEKKTKLVEEFTSLVKDFKQLFSTAKFADLKLKDGSIIRIDTDVPQEGTAVKVLDTTGAENAVPDGEYEVVTDAGNLKITVVAGFITQVETIAEETVADPNATDDTQMNDEKMQKLETAMSEMATRLAAIEEKIGAAALTSDVNSQVEKQGADLKTEIANVLSKFDAHEKFSKELFALVEKLGEVEGDPTGEPKDKTTKVLTPRESIEAFRKTQKI